MRKHYRGDDGKAKCGRQVEESAFASDELEFNLYSREGKTCIPCEASLIREKEKESLIFSVIMAVVTIAVVVVVIVVMGIMRGMTKAPATED